MVFEIGYSDGHELLGSERVNGADAVCEAEQKCQSMSAGNIGVVLLEPSLSFRDGQWFVQYSGVERPLNCDYKAGLWSGDGQQWESCYHAIERLFSSSI